MSEQGTTKEQVSEAAEIANSFIRYAYEQQAPLGAAAMTDPVPCEDCGKPLDRMGVHAQTCEQRRSKDLAKQLRDNAAVLLAPGTAIPTGAIAGALQMAADEIERVTKTASSGDWMTRWSALQLANESTQSIAATALFCEVVAALRALGGNHG